MECGAQTSLSSLLPLFSSPISLSPSPDFFLASVPSSRCEGQQESCTTSTPPVPPRRPPQLKSSSAATSQIPLSSAAPPQVPPRNAHCPPLLSPPQTTEAVSQPTSAASFPRCSAL
ncbi:hypothetical protein I3760_11G060200 [Carya illinoinensis]|nr:hypothetical protein I3760_11G060200 [Carya illinoinensis]